MGGVGYLTNNGQDLGNRYTKVNNLGTTIGYYNSAGTDLGYLRGNGKVTPNISAGFKWNNYGIRQSYNCCEESEGSCVNHCWENYDSRYVYTLNPRLTNFVNGHSYTLHFGQVLWTNSGASRGCAYTYIGVNPNLDFYSYFGSTCYSLKTNYESKHNFPSRITEQCGNRHGQSKSWVWYSYNFTNSLNLGVCFSWCNTWAGRAYAKVKYYITDNTTGLSSGTIIGPEICLGNGTSLRI